MTEDEELRDLAARWFSKADEIAHDRLYRTLMGRLFAPPGVVSVLGSGAVDDVRQTLVAALLDRTSGALVDAVSPIGLAKTAFTNALKTQVRKWGPRAQREDEVRRHLELVRPGPAYEEVERARDLERVLEIAAQLEGKGRLALLLTTAPDRIPQSDWEALVAGRPPPPPKRPDVPVEKDAASHLLFPPVGPETEAMRRQRMNSFEKCYARAVARIRVALTGDET